MSLSRRVFIDIVSNENISVTCRASEMSFRVSYNYHIALDIIQNKLRQKYCFLFNILGLYRLRSMIGTTSGLTIVREVSPFFIAAGLELERMHPKLYTGIVRQTSAAPGGVLVSDKTAATLLVAIGHEQLKSDITWGKVVSVFAVAGGLAVDCVSQGHPEYVHGLMEAITEVLEENVADWVSTNGGWVRSKSYFQFYYRITS